MLCGPNQKTLSSACNTVSNFKTHLDTIHKTTKLVEKPVKGKLEMLVLKMTMDLLDLSNSAYQ